MGETKAGPPLGNRVTGGRLAYERGIRYSSLPAPSRHIALTIATWADMDSGVIPDRFQPAKETLEAATGLSRGAIVKHLNLLEAEGWLSRETGGGRSRRTKFRLRIPQGAKTGHETTPFDPGNGSPDDLYPEETGHVVPETGHVVNVNGSPGDPKSPSSPYQSPPPADPPAPPTAGGGGGNQQQDEQQQLQRATALVASLDYGDQRPSRSQNDWLIKLVDAALAGGWSEDALRKQIDPGDAKVGSRLAIYLHRLKPEQLPEPPARTRASPGLPEWCTECGGDFPEQARTNPKFRTINGKPCEACHPDHAEEAA